MSSSPSDSEAEHFADALNLPPAERAQFLERLRAERPDLHQRVEALLRAYHHPVSAFLETSPFWPTRVPAEEKIGDWIDGYCLAGKLGEGGWGVVYRAKQDRPLRREVALKIIKLGMDTRAVIARFQAERQALAMMDHPNIAKVFDAGATPTGRPYFAMELVPGIRITDYCDRQRLSVSDRLALFVQVCAGIQHAHQKGIIHRDIKPSNVLVWEQDGSPAAKIIDFGIAKATEGRRLDQTLVTAVTELIGTPAYMSPEQSRANAWDVDTRTDVYSLGVLLYELLTGTLPFEPAELIAAGVEEARRRIREQDPPRPSVRLSRIDPDTLVEAARRRGCVPPALLRDVSGDLEWIILRCLEKDRARRYAEVSGLASDLRRFLSDQPVEARPPTRWYLAGKFARRHRVALSVAASFVALLGVATAVSADLAVRARRAEARSAADAATAEAEAGFLQNDLLARASPENGGGSDVTLRTVLDRAATKLDGRFANAPVVEAALQETVGMTYGALGDYEAMERHLRRALHLRLSGAAADPRNALRLQSELVPCLRNEGKLKEAESLGETTLAAQSRLLGPEHPDTLNTSMWLGGAYYVDDEWKRAETLIAQVCGVRQRHGGDDVDTLKAMETLAMIYGRQRRLQEGSTLAREVVARADRTLGRDHPQTLHAMLTLADAELRLGQSADALALLEETLARRTQVLGPLHPETLVTVKYLADSCAATGKLARAEALYRQALDGETAVLGREHPYTLNTMNNLALALKLEKKLPEAEALARRTLAIRQRTMRPNFDETAGSMMTLASVYAAEGRGPEAGILQAQAEALRHSTGSPALSEQWPGAH